MNKTLFKIRSLTTIKLLKNESSFISIMETAAIYYANELSNDWKECIVLACRAYKLKDSLKSGIVSFTFKKKDGTTRDAVGTLNGNYFEYESKGASRVVRLDVIKYFDLDRQSFRSLRIESLMSINQSISKGVAA